jgi:hypothetical protein
VQLHTTNDAMVEVVGRLSVVSWSRLAHCADADS